MSMFRGFQYFALSIAIMGASAEAKDKFDFSGFARMVGGWLDTEEAEFKGYDNELDFRASTLLGLQAEYQVLDSLAITSQVVGRADSNNESSLEWLYLTWKPINAFQIKAGKLRTPFFTFSDYTDVGYAYHWISPPTQVYNAYLFSSYDGIDLTWNYTANNFDVNLEVYAGESEAEANAGPSPIDYTINNLRGIIGTINVKNFQLRASRYQSGSVLDLPQLDSLATILNQAGFPASADSLSTERSARAHQIGITYNNLKYFVHSEWIKLDADFGVLPEIASGYVSAGYYLGPLTLHLTFANSDSDPKAPLNEIPVGLSSSLDQLALSYQQTINSFIVDHLTSWTVGVRWDVQQNLALKFDWTVLQGELGNASFFNNIDAGFNRKANLYQFGVEWVF